jgi:hypothetical protein
MGRVGGRGPVNVAEAASLAARLTGCAVSGAAAIGGGGNNQLFRIEAAERTFALKCYAGNPGESRERYTREFEGLAFLWQHGERRVAEPLALDAHAQAAVYAWVEGHRCGPATAADLSEMSAFAGTLHELRHAPNAPRLRDAREAVFSAAELGRQLAMRLARLRGVEEQHPQLRGLLNDIEREGARHDPGPRGNEQLADGARTLSPSDFGTHNALRTPVRLAFVDFEYFGWDDPVKLVADVLWHPAMALDAPARQKFFAAAADVYKVEAEFTARFDRDAPLYGLRWALIVLNEFLPEVWQRRVSAGAVDDAGAARGRQFAKADALVERVRRGRVIA